MIDSLFAALEQTPVAVAIAESGWLFPTVETAHVIALALVAGSIAIMDLRLLSLAGRSHPVTRLADDVLPWTWISFAAAVLTGAALFSSGATTYWDNIFFRVKLVLLAAAGVNMLIFHLVVWRSVHRWDTAAATPPAAKAAGLLSLMFWIGVIICGRWIGFA